jgi:hypothetical protein
MGESGQFWAALVLGIVVAGGAFMALLFAKKTAN